MHLHHDHYNVCSYHCEIKDELQTKDSHLFKPLYSHLLVQATFKRPREDVDIAAPHHKLKRTKMDSIDESPNSSKECIKK